MKRFHRFGHLLWMMGLVVALVVVLGPLGKPGFFVSDDGEWMIIRLSAFYQSLTEGQFPVRFLGRLNNGYGYPVANFLYPGFLYIGSVIHLLGATFVDTIKIILIGSLTTGAIVLYVWLRRFYRHIPSVVGTVGFVVAPYVAFDLYHRGSVGEILSLFAGIWTLGAIDMGIPWLFPFALAFLLVSHNSLALLFSLTAVMYIVITKKRGFFLPFVLGVGMAAFFWIPAWFERRYVLFDTIRISDPSAYFLNSKTWLLMNGIPFIAIMLLWKKQREWSPRVRFFAILFLVATFFASPLSTVFWKWQPLNMLFQFPYRFLSLGTVAGSWVIAELLERKEAKSRMPFLIVCVAVWGVSLIGILRSVVWVERPEGYYTTNEATTTVADEYMPHWVKEKPRQRAFQRLEFFQGRGTIVMKKDSLQKIEAWVEVSEDSTLQINILYYPGWGVAVDGQPVRIDYRNSQGLMRIPLEPGAHELVAEFRETGTRFIADTVSLVSLLLAIGFIVIYLKRRPTRVVI